MRRVVLWLAVAVLGLAALQSAGPTLLALSHALVPLVVAVGVVAIGVRLAFFHTRRW